MLYACRAPSHLGIIEPYGRGGETQILSGRGLHGVTANKWKVRTGTPRCLAFLPVSTLLTLSLVVPAEGGAKPSLVFCFIFFTFDNTIAVMKREITGITRDCSFCLLKLINT